MSNSQKNNFSTAWMMSHGFSDNTQTTLSFALHAEDSLLCSSTSYQYIHHFLLKLKHECDDSVCFVCAKHLRVKQTTYCFHVHYKNWKQSPAPQLYRGHTPLSPQYKPRLAMQLPVYPKSQRSDLELTLIGIVNLFLAKYDLEEVHSLNTFLYGDVSQNPHASVKAQ